MLLLLLFFWMPKKSPLKETLFHQCIVLILLQLDPIVEKDLVYNRSNRLRVRAFVLFFFIINQHRFQQSLPFLLWLKTLSTTTQKRLILIDTLPLSLVCGGNIRVCQMVLNSSFNVCMNITYWRNKPNGQKCNFSQFQFWLIFQIFILAILANFKK